MANQLFLSFLLALAFVSTSAQAASEVELTGVIVEQDEFYSGCQTQYIGLSQVSGPAGYQYSGAFEAVALKSGPYCLSSQNLQSWGIPAASQRLVQLADVRPVDVADGRRVRVKGALATSGTYAWGMVINTLNSDLGARFALEQPALAPVGENYGITFRHTTTDDITPIKGRYLARRYQIGSGAGAISGVGYGTLKSQTLVLTANVPAASIQGLAANYPDGKVPVRVDLFVSPGPNIFDENQMLRIAVDNSTLDLCAAGFCLLDQSRKIAAGQTFTCAIQSDKTVKCWGGDPTGLHYLTEVYTVPGVTGAKAITAGDMHACVLTEQNAVKCWGSDAMAQLGDGGTFYSPTFTSVAVDVVGLSGVKAISAGAYNTCAITAQDTLKCWGHQAIPPQWGGFPEWPAPEDVPGLSGVRAVAVGSAHICAILADSSVNCLGYNHLGQLANPTLLGSSEPLVIAGVSGARAIAAGAGFHTCVITAQSTVKCWGDNNYGMLGVSYASNPIVWTPIEVPMSSGTKAISTGYSHTCLLFTSGAVRCLGGNYSGQLGNGTDWEHGFELSTVPVDVVGLTDGTDVAVGTSHSCAQTASGVTKCWGANFEGQLGTGTTTPSSVPVVVGSGLPISALNYYNNSVRPALQWTCAGCHAISDSQYATFLSTPWPTEGGSATNNALINAAVGINHGGGNRCGTVNGFPCGILQTWWNLQYNQP